MAYENTLLIVESPTIQKIINNFDLPYLTPVATHGFCWRPTYDEDTQRLSLKAIAGKRKIRNEIRDQARWASQVIIATDADAAGQIIAYGVQRHLQRFDLNLQRTYLNGLSKSGIQHSLQRARPYSSTNPKQRLENRYQWTQLLRKKVKWEQIPIQYLHAILGLIAILFSSRPRRHYVDQDGNYYLSPDTPEKSADQTFHVRSQGLTELNRTNSNPLNTADVLQLMKQRLSYTSYSEAQKDLNALFTQVPDELKSGLISYPRTKQNGYYRSTWDTFEKQWVRDRSWETLLPRPMRQKVSAKVPHEAIHPLNINTPPKSVRPYVAKKYYDLYQLIYGYQFNVLRRPSRMNTVYFKEAHDERAIYIRTAPSHRDSTGNTAILTPCLTVASIAEKLMCYKAIRPSRIGELLDYLYSKQYIKLSDQQLVQAGEQLKEFSADIQNMEALLSLLNTVSGQLDGNLELDMISNLLTSIFEK